MSKSGLNPRDIIKKLSVGGDGHNGETKGEKQKRYLMGLIEGKKKPEQLKLLRELYPDDKVWSEMETPVERLPVK